MWCLDHVRGRRWLGAGVLVSALAVPVTAYATFPDWLQHIVGASAVESALYRAMQLPVVQALYPRPPKEAAGELTKLIAGKAGDAALYALRARADEQALEEGAAEADWKLYVAHAGDPVAAKLELADFYQRRLMVPQEIAVLREVAAAPAMATEAYIEPGAQRSWLAFERILGAIYAQGLPASETASTFNAFVARYPEEPTVYAAYLQFEMEQKDWAGTQAVIDRYAKSFPRDKVFVIRAQALLEFRRGNVDAALAVYDRGFQPLWPSELIQSYFGLLETAHRQRAFVAAAREKLAARPDGPEALNALARIFYYDQQAGRTESAQQTLDAFRTAREARNGAWSAEDLSTLATLSLSIHSYAEAARYDYALAASSGTVPSGEPAAQAGLAGLVDILLAAPEQPLAIGAQNLTLYRDIATLDQGPGYWNGILSLWLNGESPATEYKAETAKAQRYFHRGKAAELLAELDKRFPAAPERAALHVQLIRALAEYGEPATVISAGKAYLTAFPGGAGRLDVVNLMADAYAREGDTAGEFALYDAELDELAAKTNGLPLTSASTALGVAPEPGTVEFYVRVQDPESVDSNRGAAQKLTAEALVEMPKRKSLAEGSAYSSLLDRYVGRLTATGQLPRAMTVLRNQLGKNPNDPLLYERLATFFQQNNLSAEEEQIYQQAAAKFQGASNYDKLARLYLREKKREAFGDLAKKVTDIFSGTDLDKFFENVNPKQPIGPQLALQLDLYAAKRFPHDVVFTRNLLDAYQAKNTRDDAAYEALLRRQWWASDELRDEFLAYLSRTGKLESELAQVAGINKGSAAAASLADPVAVREQAEIDVFESQFEQAAPLLGAVAEVYPADADVGDRAVSLYRSLAYLDPQPASTLRAVGLESNLLKAAPDSPDRLATLGDLYAEATSEGGEDLAAAAPYWRKIPELHPNSTQGYLTSATIFWDYFQFDEALAEIHEARTRLGSPELFGYEAGAIEENRRNVSAAVVEYTNAVIHPIEIPRHFDSAVGVIDAWLKPPSDAGDSQFKATAQSFLGSEEAKARLVVLATRGSTRESVDAATAKAVVENPANTAALTLRADVLVAQHPGAELKPLLTSLFEGALDRASTLDEATAVGALAQARSLTPVYERALAKEATLTPDPVQKIELQYALEQSLETQEDVAGATRVVDAVYAANPRSLGVVRATTDFYTRTNRPARAIATLLEAAKIAAPMLAHDFTLEAASRANDAGDTTQARALGNGLLAQAPYDARALDVVATSYARVHDDAGLKQFYLARLEAARGAPGVSADARKEHVAVMRRGLIPALTRLNDFSGATDQYVALISVFPEDAGLGQEAALYALRHGRQAQLLEFLRTTVKASPRDSRFMILLATTEATFDDLPAAEAAYSLAIGVRKDRVDLYSARADIEMRLGQADAAQLELAAADFERLYALSYHDPSWMVQLAELRARQRRPADAVKALQTAYVEGHVQAAGDYFTVAARLEGWNLLAEARGFAAQGLTIAGSELLNPPASAAASQSENGAVVYARIFARSGKAGEALEKLTEARRAAEVSAASPSVLAAELARENISDDEADNFRKNFATLRRQTADQNLRAAVEALGKAVATYYTPEQKQSFALVLDKLHDTAQPHANPALALQAATAAGLEDREADWRKRSLPADERGGSQLNAYVALQEGRLQFAALAHDLEEYAARVVVKRRTAVMEKAEQAFRNAGDEANEARVARPLVVRGDAKVRDRYFELLLRRDAPGLAALAGNSNAGLADAALNYTVAHGTEAEALAAVASRGQGLHPVWRPASASLVETYFAGTPASAGDPADFNESLAVNSTIGSRIGTAADPARQLTGDTYFYYASRFGIFLATMSERKPSLPDAEDFLPGELEGSPSETESYLNLARSYVEAHKIAEAVAEYGHAIELAPSDPAIEDELATALYRAKRQDEALVHWKRSLTLLSEMQQEGTYPESWFTAFGTVLGHLGEYHLAATCRAEIEGILGPYLAKNGSYRSNELLKAAYSAAPNAAEGAEMMVAAADAATDPNQILDDLSGAAWISGAARETILQRQIGLAGEHAASASTGQSAGTYQKKLVDLYLDRDEVAKAEALFAVMAEKDRKDDRVDEIVLAVRGGRLQGLVDAWSADSDSVPKDAFDLALAALEKPTAEYKPKAAEIRPLREFIFEYKRQNASLIATDFLGLAQMRIDTGDVPGALDLLKQLTVRPSADEGTEAKNVAGSDGDAAASTDGSAGETSLNSTRNMELATALLEKNHLAAEAIPFLQSLVTTVPWDSSYRLRLAEAELASKASDKARGDFVAVAQDALAPYGVRVRAARALGGMGAGTVELGSAELSFVAHPTTAAAARQPYAAAARIAAAGLAATSAADREALLREAIAIEPRGTEAAREGIDLLMLLPAEEDASGTLAIVRELKKLGPGDGAPADDAGAGAAELSLLPPGAADRDVATQVRLASKIASANEHEGNLTIGLRYAELAVTLAKGPETLRRRDALKTELLLTQRNRLRRPELHAGLEQKKQVRPQLTAAALQEDSQ